MKYLADENVAVRIVAWLRNRGDDVRYAAEERPGENDSQWLREAFYGKGNSAAVASTRGQEKGPASAAT